MSEEPKINPETSAVEPAPSPTLREEQPRSGGAMVGYTIAIIINAILWYVFDHWLSWEIPLLTAEFGGYGPFLTSRFSEVLWAVHLSLGATIVANVIFLTYDPRWFKRLMQIVMDCCGWISLRAFYQVFPLETGMDAVNQAVRLALLVALVVVAIAIVVNAVKLAAGKD
jgi:hypothetical protein